MSNLIAWATRARVVVLGDLAKRRAHADAGVGSLLSAHDMSGHWDETPAPRVTALARRPQCARARAAVVELEGRPHQPKANRHLACPSAGHPAGLKDRAGVLGHPRPSRRRRCRCRWRSVRAAGSRPPSTAAGEERPAAGSIRRAMVFIFISVSPHFDQKARVSPTWRPGTWLDESAPAPGGAPVRNHPSSHGGRPSQAGRS